MARPRTRKPPHQPNSRVLVASGAALPVVKPYAVRASADWQSRVWQYYDQVPELRFVANWVGNVMSRAELQIVRAQPGADRVVDTGPAVAALGSYFEGEAGQKEMQRLTGIHLTVAGECYHVYRNNDRTWHVLAAGKVVQTGSGDKATIRADFGDGTTTTLTPGTDLVIRVWQPHPTNPMEADSPARANMGTLEEIVRASGAAGAILMSRLAGAGLLLLPNEMEFAAPTEDKDPATDGPFMQALQKAMVTAIAAPDSAAAVVPITVQAPSEAIAAARHLTFGADLSEQIRLLRDSAVRRLALGMDIPPEVLTGIADTNRWNAWLIDESSIKAHIEPRVALLANAITTAYLWPALDGDTTDRVGADTTAIRLRPNRSREAIELWDRGELSNLALRRETGFGEEDNPSDDERKGWLLRRIATASAVDPIMVADALRILGVDVAPPAPAPTRGVREAVPSLTEHPGRDLPDDAMLAAANVLVMRALERAGNRLRSKHNYTGRMTSMTLYRELPGNPDTLLDGAWDLLPDAVPGADEGLALALDQYVRGLLHTQAPHTLDGLRRHLAAFEALVVH